MRERCCVPNGNTCARVSNTRDGVSYFYKGGIHFSTFLHIFIGARHTHILILGRPTSLVINSGDVLTQRN